MARRGETVGREEGVAAAAPTVLDTLLVPAGVGEVPALPLPPRAADPLALLLPPLLVAVPPPPVCVPPERDGGAEEEGGLLAEEQPEEDGVRGALPDKLPPDADAVATMLPLCPPLSLRCRELDATPETDPAPPELREPLVLGTAVKDSAPEADSVAPPADGVFAAGEPLTLPHVVVEGEAAAEAVSIPVPLPEAQGLRGALAEGQNEGKLLTVRGGLSEEDAVTVVAERETAEVGLVAPVALRPDVKDPSRRLAEGVPEEDKQEAAEPEGAREALASPLWLSLLDPVALPLAQADKEGLRVALPQ